MAGRLKVFVAETAKEIEAIMAAELEVKIKSLFSGALKEIKTRVREVVKREISNCPEMKSLDGGVLQFDIGLTGGQATAIVEGWANAVAGSVNVKLRPISMGKTTTGGITIEIQPEDYSNKLNTELRPIWGDNMDDTSYTALVDSLLLAWGDRILIMDYDIEYGSFGRSGGAKMKKKKGGKWGIGAGLSRVPPQFAGTVENNFITRTLGSDVVQVQIKTVIIRALNKVRVK